MARLSPTALLIWFALASAQPASLVKTYPSPVTIMPLGNSITELHTGYESYRCWLWKSLQDSGVTADFVGSRSGVWAGFPGRQAESSCPYADFDEQHEGHYGWEAWELVNGRRSTNNFGYPGNLTQWLTANNPHIALLEIGTADLDRGQTVAQAAQSVSRIIDTIRLRGANAIVFLSTILPAKNGSPNVTPYNNQLPPLAASKNVPGKAAVVLVDQQRGFDVNTMLQDNFHPTVAGEKVMAGTWLNLLYPFLRGGVCTLNVTVEGLGAWARGCR